MMKSLPRHLLLTDANSAYKVKTQPNTYYGGVLSSCMPYVPSVIMSWTLFHATPCSSKDLITCKLLSLVPSFVVSPYGTHDIAY